MLATQDSTERRTALITGCSEGGIGDALAQEFHNRGVRVIASARNLSKVQHLKELGIEIIALDVADEASVKDAVKKVKEMTGGSLDILVNNSGGGYNMTLMDSNLATARKMFDVNVFGLVAVTQAFVPFMLKSKHARIVNMSSVSGRVPVPWQTLYNSSKAAVEAISDNLRVELLPFGIQVINVMAGGVGTKFFNNVPGIDLPESSIYSPVKDELLPHIRGDYQQELLAAYAPERFAAEVVTNTLKDHPKKQLWVGNGALQAWFMTTFLWHTWSEMVIPRAWKLMGVFQKLAIATK